MNPRTEVLPVHANKTDSRGSRAFALLASLSLAALLWPVGLNGQLTSVLPGIPSAGLPDLGNSQSRITLGSQFARETPQEGTSWLAGTRVAWGRSFRIIENLEAGFSFTWFDVTYQRLADPLAESLGASWTMDAHGLFGVRLGAKYRLFSHVDLEGRGWQAAIHGRFQPALGTAASVRVVGDSTTVRTLGREEDEPLPPALEPWTDVPQQSEFGVVVDYSSTRVFATLGMNWESAEEETNGVIESHTGLTPLAGASYRLTPGFSLGFSFWGVGSPPWAGESRVRDIDRNSASAGLVLTFGEPSGNGSDLMISTPFGSAGQSVRIHYRTRAFR